jgi:hypothetical protein
MRYPRKIDVTLSGRVRVRPGLFGRIVPQVELHTLEYSACPPMPGSDPKAWERQMKAEGVACYAWRDATWDDMQMIGVMVPAHWPRAGSAVGGVNTPDGGQ